jgi:anaphase-promoting complex subunit 10
MAFTRSERKFNDDDDDDDDEEVEGSQVASASRGDGTTTLSADADYQSPYHQFIRSTTTNDHRVQPVSRRMTRYAGQQHHRHGGDTSTGTPTTTPSASYYTAARETRRITRYQSRRDVATTISTEHPRSTSSSFDHHSPTYEGMATPTFLQSTAQQPRGSAGNANGDNDDVEDEVGDEEEEAEDDDYDEEEVEDEDDEEEEVDDGSTATIRAPHERRSSHPMWSATAGSSSDMGTDDAGIPQTSTTTSVPNDGTDQDELLVGSGSSADGGDTTVAASTNHLSMVLSAVPNLHSLFQKQHLREVGIDDILSIQLSSAKPGNGVEQLYDPSYDTYWQSDGTCQPHWILIQLPRRLPVTHVALYLDYQLDESYTPCTVQIETGLTVVQDSQPNYSTTTTSDAPVMELHEPVGWCIFPVHVPPDPFDTSNANADSLVFNDAASIPRAHWVRVSILSMHQNGRDTHVRRVALFCQRTTTTVRMPQPQASSKLPLTGKTNASSDTTTSIGTTRAVQVPLSEEDDCADHEEILLYAQTRSNKNYDSGSLQRNYSKGDQQSNLFAMIR